MSKRTHKPDPAQGPVHLLAESFGKPGCVAIHGLPYHYKTCCDHGPEAVKLVYVCEYGTAGRDGYHVALLANGHYDCTCADFVYRKCERGEFCKHITAMRELGLLPSDVADEPHVVEDVCPDCNGVGTYRGDPDAYTCHVCGGDGVVADDPLTFDIIDGVRWTSAVN